MIIWGYRTRITASSKDDVLEKSCPNCGSDLVLSDLKRWFTLYFIPIFPISTIETLYHCKNCDSSYKEKIKDMLKGSKQNQEKFELEAKKMFAVALASCMTHMAKADGKVSKEEKEHIDKILSKFPKQFKKDIDAAKEKVMKSKNDDVVFNILRNAQKILTAEAFMVIIAQIAKVLLADGKIDKKEEQLMKEYMLVAGIPRELYDDMIKRIKEGKK